MSEDIKVYFTGGKKVDAEMGDFIVKTDQPVYAGGENTAPAPFALFLASLATCAGYYVMAFCQSRNITYEGITLAMKTEKNPEIRRIGKIFIDINLPEGFPEKYKKAVIKSVNRCTVKVHMQYPPEFIVEAHIAG